MHRAIPFDEIHRWMFDTALPLWADVGFDGQTGTFAEKLAFSGKPIDTGFHRTRVTGRQTYVFAHAALMGWERGQDLAAAGARKLNAIYQGPEHGWPRTTNTAGDVIDGTPDLYDLAFTLFGFAWHYRASQDPESLASAHRALDFIELHMRAPVGFWHELPPSGWRLQNPHMHLLEASLVAFEASGDERFLKTAKQIVTLFRDHLFDGRTLAEYFDADWSRAPGDEGQLAEPGHQLEWAWILIQYGRLAGEDTLALTEALVGFAEAHGFDDRTGRVLQVVRSDGTIVDAGSRTWPNTERIKGHLALFEATGRDPRQAVATSARVLLDTYLATEVPGLWIDRFNADGLPEASDAPASTLYHVFLAFAEILRLRDAIEAIAD